MKSKKLATAPLAEFESQKIQIHMETATQDGGSSHSKWHGPYLHLVIAHHVQASVALAHLFTTSWL